MLVLEAVGAEASGIMEALLFSKSLRESSDKLAGINSFLGRHVHYLAILGHGYIQLLN